jgi:hypothetical protein
VHLAFWKDTSVQVAFWKAKAWNQKFLTLHAVGSRVETGCVQALWVNCVHLVRSPTDGDGDELDARGVAVQVAFESEL